MMLTGSNFQVGFTDGGRVGVRNNSTSSITPGNIELVHGPGTYSSFRSNRASGTLNLRGDTVKVQGSGSLTSGVSMEVYGDVTASNFLGTASVAT